ncbi:GTPase-activating protein gyp1 [Diplonema papillatum]|nr:GTPase-activating protein gyp1 [Diplonema papillatum]
MSYSYEHVNEHVNDDIKRELEAEMVVDLDRLREASKDGIPVNSRKNVWKYLLLVTTVDKSEEMTLARKKEDEYFGHLKLEGECDLLRSLMTVFQAQFLANPHEAYRRDLARCVLKVFLSSHTCLVADSVNPVTEAAWCRSVTSIVNQFIGVMGDPVSTYHAFANFFERLHGNTTFLALVRDSVATLSMLFRITQPALYQSFDAEEVNPNEWALEWFSTMLAGQLRANDVRRLWDVYLVDMAEATELHIYVCLALLQIYSERLMELERTGILKLLNNLPPSPMQKVINLARSIREDVLSRELL